MAVITSPVVAVVENPAGSCVTWSPWLIQTSSSNGSSLNRAVCPLRTFSLACPYSRLAAGSFLPPRSTATICIP